MTYTIKFQCPSCDANIKAPSQLIGHTKHCPRCKSSFVVRGPAEEANEFRNEFTPRIPLPDSDPILIGPEGDTVDMLIENVDGKPEPGKRLEDLEAENARLKRLVADLARVVGQ